jgi:hypothetical protein
MSFSLELTRPMNDALRVSSDHSLLNSLTCYVIRVCCYKLFVDAKKLITVSAEGHWKLNQIWSHLEEEFEYNLCLIQYL